MGLLVPVGHKHGVTGGMSSAASVIRGMRSLDATAHKLTLQNSITYLATFKLEADVLLCLEQIMILF